MGLFTKANCVICGAETSSLHRYKLNDGTYLCGDCLSKVNVTEGGFSAAVLKSSSVDEIEERMKFVEKDLMRNAERLEKFTPTLKESNYIWFDDKNKWFVIPQGLFKVTIDDCYVFEYKEIVDYEVLEDGTSITKGGLGKALVGGAVFGIAGAIAGGTSKRTKQVCTDLKLKITTKNSDQPVIYIPFIMTETKKDSMVYRTASTSIQRVLSKFQIISEELEAEQKESSSADESSTISVADEIKRFKELCDAGVITKDEFEAKKKKLLDL